MPFGELAPAALEDWLRERYHNATVDISSSGVENYTLGELRELLSIPAEQLDRLPFRDSPSLGSEPLREAIHNRFRPGPNHAVVCTHGSTEAILLAMAAVIRPGDEVIVLRPAYHALVSVAEALGAKLQVWELDADDGFQADLDRLRALFSRRTRAVVVNFPHNPTGTTLSHATQAELLVLLAETECYLFWDAAFGELVYDRPPLPDPSTFIERSLSFGTLSKAYGLPGLRVGWCIAPEPVLDEMVRIRDYVSLSTSPLNELIAVSVLNGADAVLGPRLQQARTNREAVRSWAEENPDTVSLQLPAGGVTAFPRFPGIADVTSISEALAQDHGVLTVPGACFGHPSHMRIGFGGPPCELAEGLSRLTEMITTSRSASPTSDRGRK